MLSSYVVTYLLIGLIWMGLALFVYLANTEARLNRAFAIYCLSIGWWSIFSLPAVLTKNSALAVWFCRIFIIGPIFIPSCFLHFNLIFLELDQKYRKILLTSYATSIFFLFANITPYFIASASPRFSLYNYTDPGWLFHLHFFHFFAVVSITLWLICLNQRYSPDLQPTRRKQLDYLRWMALFGYAGGAPNYLLVYHMEIPWLMPYGNFLVTLYGIATAYSIVRDKFLDIEVIIRRTAVFAGLFAFVYGVFTAVTVIGQQFFMHQMQWNQWMAMIPIVFIITFSLRPLEIFLTNVTEKFLFQKKYDYRELLRTFTNEVLTLLELQKLTEQTVMGLNKIIKLESAAILLMDKDTKIYKLAASVGVKDRSVNFTEKDTIVTYLKQTHQPILREKSVDQLEGHSHLREDFKKLNARLCLPIAHHDELIGVLSLGMKKSGQEFTQEDTDILMTLARTLAIALANAQLFDQLSLHVDGDAVNPFLSRLGRQRERQQPLGVLRRQLRQPVAAGARQQRLELRQVFGLDERELLEELVPRRHVRELRHRLRHRPVQLIEINAIDTEALQAGLALGDHLSRCRRAIEHMAIGAQSEFREDQRTHAASQLLDRASDNALRVT